MKKLEVCVDSLESAKIAIDNGADELELCSALNQGGLTPSVGFVGKVLGVIFNLAIKPGCERPKINVMIRCHAGPDFCFTEEELETMLMDIEIFKSLGVDRFVFGSLTPAKSIEPEHCRRVVELADPLPVTFHRAIDVCNDPLTNLGFITLIGFDRVLTSGGQASVGHMDAIKLILRMLGIHGDIIDIMPGGGINVDNARMFIDIGCKIIHSSCKVLTRVINVDNDLGLGGLTHVYHTNGADVKAIKEIISN